MNSNRAFYFVVVFWGPEHREYFLRFLVASLLSPGNLLALENKAGSRFLICTTGEDWETIKDDPNFLALRQVIQPLLLEIPIPAPSDNKYLAMSGGHKLATAKVFEDRACGVFLTPDLVVADGGVATLQKLARAGKKVVLCAAMRYTYEGAVPEIEALRSNPLGSLLVLPPRKLADIALRHMHVETLRYDWDAPWFAEMPFSCFWRVQDGAGILIHNFNWAPVLVDYSNVTEHQVETFEHSTMDADYIYKNFQHSEDIHVIQDSDHFLLISFTKKEDRPGYLAEGALQASWEKTWLLLGYYWKLHQIRLLLNSGAIDPLKRDLFRLTVRMHGGKVRESSWRTLERRAATIVARALAPCTVIEWLCARMVRFVQSSRVWPFVQLNRLNPNVVPLIASNQELVNQAGVGTYRTWALCPALTVGKWYWEVFSPNVGIARGDVLETVTVGVIVQDHSIQQEVGGMKSGWGWRCDGKRLNGGRTKAYGSPVDGENQCIMVAVDLDLRKIWFGLNGRWLESGDPIRGANPAFQNLPILLYPAVSSKHGGCGTAILQVCVTADSWRYRPPEDFQSLIKVELVHESRKQLDQVSEEIGSVDK